jgi:hypothetical protein
MSILGVESTKQGPDLFEFAELLVKLGAQEVRPRQTGQTRGAKSSRASHVASHTLDRFRP